MSRWLIAVVGTALAVLMLLGAFDAADAMDDETRAFRKRALHGGHGRVFATDTFEARRLYGNPMQANPFALGAPAVQGAHVFGDGCHRLKRRALATGSGAAWARYDACRAGFY